MIENIIQVLILILSASAIWLVSQKSKWSRWGHIVGLAAQPLWALTTIQNEQWGLFVLTLFYSYCWSMGIYNYWIKKEKMNETV